MNRPVEVEEEGMHKRSRYPDLLIVLMLVAIGIYYSSNQDEPAPEVASPEKVVVKGEGFTLPSRDGPVTYSGEGPLLLVLTAPGCGGCLERIDQQDRSAYAMAHQAGIPVWNVLVYSSAASTSLFEKRFNPSADRLLGDPGGAVTVRRLGGSDSTCWMFFNGSTTPLWKGPADPDRLAEVLKKGQG